MGCNEPKDYWMPHFGCRYLSLLLILDKSNREENEQNYFV